MEGGAALQPGRPLPAAVTTPDRAWRWAARLLALSVLIPLLIILGSWLYLDPEVWSHLGTTVLPALLVNTGWLLVGVGIGSCLLGVPLAWLTTMCDFPGRRVLDWALMLPFALPAYVLAFVFVGVLDFSGPLQAGLRQLLGLPPSWSFEVRNTLGVIIVMTLVLYPYVYMLARLAFLGQGASAYEAGRSLGLGPWAAFFRVSLPMARPAIIAGLSLALMEALADFGAVSVFNFDTFTTAIYKSWFGFFDLQSAAQLASILLTLVLVVYVISNLVQEEAGLLAVTTMGIVVGNMNLPGLQDMKRFKEYITVMLVSVVFVLLTATMDPNVVRAVNWSSVALIAAIMFLVRPAAIVLATIGAGMRPRASPFVRPFWPRRLRFAVQRQPASSGTSASEISCRSIPCVPGDRRRARGKRASRRRR